MIFINIYTHGAANCMRFYMKNRNSILAGTICAMFAVLLGAFGAHSLREVLSESQSKSFETGVRYQFYHSFALILSVFLAERSNTKNYAASFFLSGIILFSGSLYLMVSLQVNDAWDNLKWLGLITPLGGLCFAAGWLIMAYQAYKKRDL